MLDKYKSEFPGKEVYLHKKYSYTEHRACKECNHIVHYTDHNFDICPKCGCGFKWLNRSYRNIVARRIDLLVIEKKFNIFKPSTWFCGKIYTFLEHRDGSFEPWK